MKFLFSIILIFSGVVCYAQITYETVYVDYDSAWQYKNLKIVPIRVKKGAHNPAMPGILSLSQALKLGFATVSERGTASTENVHFLRIDNHSDKSIYISSGEVIAGGRQDRMIARDTILVPTGKDQYVPVMCVEEGRWSDKEKKFMYSDFANPHLRKVLDQNKNQVLIWKEINNQLELGGIKSKTLAYLSRNIDKKMTLINDEYYNFFLDKFRKTDSSVVGFVAISGDRVIGSDIFSSKNLFYSQLEPLLKGYTDDAVLFGAPITLTDKFLHEYMDKLLKDEKSQEEFVKYNGKIFRQGGEVMHVNTF
ncbi:MAG: hypothetical protein JST75_22540 [Bacteroidetes bacterium]|nr:hypothetical protein [Bacteroidota bacterium]